MTRSALATFVGVYLDEDMFELYDDEFAAAEAFVTRNPELAGPLSAEIDDLVATMSDQEIEEVLLDLGIGIDSGGASRREWLTQIADQVRGTMA